MLSETRYEHIILNDADVPMIAGTTMKVIELVLDHLAYGWSPEGLHFQHPNLTMGHPVSRTVKRQRAELMPIALYMDHP